MEVKKLQDDMNALAAEVAKLKAKTTDGLAKIRAAFEALKAQIAAGQTITQSDLDALDTVAVQALAGVTDTETAIDAEVAAENQPPTA